jgi:hypothetical protein
MTLVFVVADRANATVSSGQTARYPGTSVGGRVIDDQYLDLNIFLLKNALDTLRQIVPVVVTWDNYCD